MAPRAFEPSFVATLPVSRAREEIVATVAAAATGRAEDAARAAVAEIELLIADGKSHYQQSEITAALNDFEKARAAIYHVLYPDFDIGQYLSSIRPVLPVSPQIEQSLIAASGPIVEAIRPKSVQPNGAFWASATTQVPDNLASFTILGLRDADARSQTFQLANERGVALLATGRPEAALTLLDSVLASNQTVGHDLPQPAIHLTRAAALLQTGRPVDSVNAARIAQEAFTAAGDAAGQAQAIHLCAVGLNLLGNPRAQAEFSRAAEIAIALPSRIAASATPTTSMPELPLTVASNTGSFTAGAATPIQAASPHLADATTLDTAVLAPIVRKDPQSVTFRILGRADGWGVLPLTTPTERSAISQPWNLGVVAGQTTAIFSLGNLHMLSAEEVTAKIYAVRRDAATANDLAWSLDDEFATSIYLDHLYSYALPLMIGDCYRAQQLYAKAEEYYLLAAQYSALNLAIEGTVLWVRLAQNAVAWGNSFYKDEDLDSAKAQYEKIVTDGATAPASFLYTLPALSVPASVATTFIANINVRPLPLDDWDIDAAILDAFRELQQINQGLDYYGLLLAPIHTFDYLQSIAQGFAREAIEAENQFITFKMRQAADEATRRELEIAKASAVADAEARRLAFVAAQQDETTAQDAVDLANKRVTDANTQRDAYKATSTDQIWSQAASQALAGGQDFSRSDIGEIAARLDRGETIKGPGAKLAAAEVLRAGRKTQEYELQKMQDNIDELVKAQTMAADQLAASHTRTVAADLAYQAAQKRVELAAAALTAFDNELFTPDSWAKMASTMQDIAEGYLFRGIRLAKLMERAYNFENDVTLKLIRNDYGIAATNPNASGFGPVLGGDLLLQDIEGFIYTAITTRTRKSCRIKDVISVASFFPAQFYAFRQTGRLTFETDLYEFDRLHPGFFCQKIQAVELEVIGLLPESGLSGSFTAGGVTSFRRRDGSDGKRVQIVDTMALSQYIVRADGIMYAAETGTKGLFQGFGIGATWQLHAPRRSNDLDLNRIFDVRLVLYYTAEFDPALETAILAAPVRPGELSQIRDFGLRYDFPDAWYGFYTAGTVSVNLERLRMPINQVNFRTRAVNLRVVTKDGLSAAGISLQITAPNGASGTGTTDANGVVTTANPALAALVGIDVVGAWQIQVTGGPSLLDGGTLRFKRVYDIQLGFEYSFDFVPEA
jgi:hypothetical protein